MGKTLKDKRLSGLFYGLFFLLLTGCPAYAAFEGYEVIETIFRSDRQSAAYVLLKDGKRHVYADGALSKPYDEVSNIVFSPDSKRMVYCVKKGGKEHFVLDGKESPAYDSV